MKPKQFDLEQKRDQMVKTAFKTGLTSEETVKLSQELDKMLNVFIPQTGTSNTISPLNKALKK